MSYSVKGVDSIGPVEAASLRKLGIRTTERLLEATKSSRGRKDLACKTGFDEKLLLKWANQADRMRIPGVGSDYAELLREAGVNTVRELKFRNAKRLTEAMRKANEKRKLVQFLPSEKVVTRWIADARKLTPKISY